MVVFRTTEFRVTKRASCSFSSSHLSCLLAVLVGVIADCSGCALGRQIRPGWRRPGDVGRVLASGGGCIPKRVLLAMLHQRRVGMWGREKNAPSGMNCGFWGARSDRANLCFSGSHQRTHPKGKDCVYQLYMVWNPTA